MEPREVFVVASMERLQAAGAYLASSARFLAPDKQEAAKAQQLSAVLEALRTARLNEVGAEAVLRASESQSCWSREDRCAMAEEIQRCLVAGAAEAPQAQRIPMQDFRNFVFYIGEVLWLRLICRETTTYEKCTELAAFLVSLGLRSVSEPTAAVVTALLLTLTATKADGADQHQSYVLVKEQLRTVLATAAPWPRALTRVLPADAQKHPVPGLPEPAAVAAVHLPSVLSLAERLPKRATNKQLRGAQLHRRLEAGSRLQILTSSGIQGDWARPLALLAPQVERGLAAAPSPPAGRPPPAALTMAVPAAPPTEAAGLPPPAALTTAVPAAPPTEPAAARTEAVAEKELRGPPQNSAEPPLPSAAPATGSTSSVLSAAALLQQELGKKKAVAHTQQLMKRPAAAAKPGTKPARAQAQPKQTAKAKARRVVVKPVAKPAAKPPPGSSRAARRERVQRLVPLRLRRQYRDGCGKCRWVQGCTPSCWILRGFTV